MDAHKAAVSAISTQVKEFYKQKTPFRLYHGSTNSTRQYKVDRSRAVDTSGLNHVLKIDREKMVCLVEPNVPMDQLVDETLPAGLLPPVVMEFPGITVGGGFAGASGESSGFKYGFFDQIISRVEMVLPDGEIVNASADERPDLFGGAAGSFGTLGVTTLLEVQLIEAKSYVELTYHPVGSVKEALEVTESACKDGSNDFVDGIQFGLDRGTIISGRLTNDVPSGAKVQHFSRASDPWFYIYTDRLTRGALEPIKEYTPIRDYLFRYDRGAFWTAKYAFQYFITPFNRITRWALDYFMHTRVMYHALHASGHASKYIVQDLLLPAKNAEEFIQYVDSTFGFYPLWLCPLKKGSSISLNPNLGNMSPDTDERYINIGVWGPGPTNYPRFVQINREVEQKVRDLGGIKWLYAQAYYTQDEFWEIYDRKSYDQLREKYNASYLPNVYDKVNVDLSKVGQQEASWPGWLQMQAWNVWPVSGVYGVLCTLLQRDYLLAK